MGDVDLHWRLLFPTVSLHESLRFDHPIPDLLSALRYRQRGGGKVRTRPHAASERELASGGNRGESRR